MTMKVELNQRECDIIVSALLDKMKHMMDGSKNFLEFNELNEAMDKSIVEVRKLKDKMIYHPNTI